MTNLTKKLIVTGALGLALLTGCAEDAEKVLSEYKSTYEEPVEAGAGYQKYAIRLKKAYPEKLGKLNLQEVYMILRDEFNNGKKLRADGNITLPKY